MELTEGRTTEQARQRAFKCAPVAASANRRSSINKLPFHKSPFLWRSPWNSFFWLVSVSIEKIWNITLLELDGDLTPDSRHDVTNQHLKYTGRHTNLIIKWLIFTLFLTTVGYWALMEYLASIWCGTDVTDQYLSSIWRTALITV